MADPTPTATVPPASAAPPPGSVTLYDKSGAPVVVDAADAPGHIMSGQLGYAPGTRVPVRINGEIGTVDAASVGDAFAKSGATAVSGKDFHDQQLQTKYGGTGQAALALGTSALDSATLGASNALIGGIGGKGTREYLRGVTEANPSAATAGDVVGFVGPIAADVLSGGMLTPELAAAEAARAGEKGLARSALETAGAAVRAPMRVASGLGDLAEGAAKAVVGSGAESRAARVAQSIIAGGARGAAEGGVYGVGQEVGSQYLQDNPELSGEALGNAWWNGAVLGGALGAGLHGVGAMLKTKTPAVERALAEEGPKAAAKESTVADAMAKQIIKQVDDPHDAQVLTNAWKEGPKAFAKHDELLGNASRKIASDLDTAIQAGREVDMASFGEAKTNQMRKLVPEENLKPARAVALQVWNDAKTVLDGLEELPMLSGEKAGIKRLRMWLDDFAKVKPGEWHDPAELFDKIDDFKRRIGKEAGFGKYAIGREESTKQFNELYDRVRLSLEDESTWGAAGTAQKEVNLATANMIDPSDKFLQRFTTQYGREAITGAPKFIAESSKVNAFVHGLTSPANDTAAMMASDYVTNRTNFLDAISKNYSLDASAKASVAKERAALASMSETIAKTGADVSQINKLKALMAEEKGHAVHGLIGMALDTVSRPGLTLARLAELEATKNRALAKIDSGLSAVKSALGGGERKAKAGLTPGSHDTYEKKRAAVISAASKPDDLHAHIQGASAPVSHTAPATAQAFQRAGLRTVQYLMTELPKPPARTSSLTPKLDAEQWQANDQQKAQYSRKFDAATHPTSLLDRVADGTITSQHVEAVQATNPATLDAQRKKLQRELESRTKPVPPNMQAPIRTLLGIPQMDPQLQRLMQSNYVTSTPHSPGLKRPIKMADTTSLNATKERL